MNRATTISSLISLSIWLSIYNEADAQVQMELDTPAIGSTIFAPQVISTNTRERDFTLSPTLDELFYTVFNTGFDGNIYYSKKTSNGWTFPVIASFSGNNDDLEPAFSPDGSRLYFSSKRGGFDYDIYYVERSTNGNWGTPVNIGSPINTSANEFYPSISEDGNLYFTAAYDHGVGGEDIWYARYNDGSYETPIPVPDINTEFDEFNAFIDPNERFIYFGSFGRPDGAGGGDIYTSNRNADGGWGSTVHLNSQVNTIYLDYCPYVSPDGRFLFFTSERPVSVGNRSKNPFDITAVLEALSGPAEAAGSDIYWLRR